MGRHFQFWYPSSRMLMGKDTSLFETYLMDVTITPSVDGPYMCNGDIVPQSPWIVVFIAYFGHTESEPTEAVRANLVWEFYSLMNGRLSHPWLIERWRCNQNIGTIWKPNQFPSRTTVWANHSIGIDGRSKRVSWHVRPANSRPSDMDQRYRLFRIFTASSLWLANFL